MISVKVIISKQIKIQQNFSTMSIQGNDEKRPCREIDTVERFKTWVEGRNVIEIYTADTLNPTDKGENVYSLRKSFNFQV